MADLFAKVTCTYCQEDINGVRVQCCECPDFDICLQCFSAGAEIGPHRNDHAYKFIDHCAISIFGGRGAWTGREQLQLLDAVELYGFGNWELVSNQVDSRTPEEVKEEYIARYLDGNIGRATWAQLANHKPNLVDHVTVDEGPLSPNAASRLPPLEATPEEARLLGYKPHRDDYEREYNMEAEQLVSKLQLEEEDNNMEIALKLGMVDMYTRRLRERARRKRIVRDYQLVAKYFANLKPTKPTLPKQQRELREKMRVFAQFLSSGEHERLVASIERERELRHRLSELLRYRSLGLTTQEEIIHYEQHAAFERQQQLKQNKSGSSGYLVQECQQRNGKEEIDSNSTEGRCTWHTQNDEQNGFSNSNSCNCNSNINNSSSMNSGNSDDDPSTLVDIKALPFGSLLSENEIQLCTSLNLQPVHYTTLKSLIIQETLLLPSSKLSKLSPISLTSNSDSQEDSIKEEVTRYLCESGWLPGLSVV